MIETAVILGWGVFSLLLQKLLYTKEFKKNLQPCSALFMVFITYERYSVLICAGSTYF